MKTIVEAENRIKLLLANLMPAGKEYSKLVYSHSISADDGYLVKNFLTGEMIFLSETEYSQYLSGIFENKELEQDLIDKLFLVPADIDDYLLATQVRNIVKMTGVPSKHITGYTIYTTTDCNARCFYCYEMSGTRRTPMSADTASDVADFIINNCGSDPVHISWFGGEPLYNLSAIDIITEKLSENQIQFNSTMVSNGYLFDDDVVEKAKSNWNLNRVQITLDGTEDVYNRNKAYIYKDGISPFIKVTDNIERLLKSGIRVNIRLNMNLDNAPDLYKLIDFLDKRYSSDDKKILSVYSALITDSKTNLVVDKAAVTQEQIKLNGYIESKGFLRSEKMSSKTKMNYCMADSDSSVTITPEGKIGKCEHYFDSDFCGDIYNGIDKDKFKSWAELIPPIEECKTCPLYPKCQYPKCCPTKQHDCDEFDRQINMWKLEKSMRYTHECYLQDEEKK